MTIRPTYRKRSVVQVLADGMSAHPPKSETYINVIADAGNTLADFSEKLRKLSEEFKEKVQVHALRDAEGNVVEHVLTPRKFAAGGYVPSPEGGDKSCCEEAQLTANEIARRDEELSEAEGEIAELKMALQAEHGSRDYWIDRYESEGVRAEKAEAERDELQAKLDAAEGWPEWMGPAPTREELGEIEVTKNSRGYWAQGVRVAEPETKPEELRLSNIVNDSISSRMRREAVARFIESEQAATGKEAGSLRKANTSGDSPDEGQRVEEQAKALANMTHDDPWKWDNIDERRRENYRATIRAGWTPPESEDEK